MKAAMICFHSNIGRYPEKWITDYVNSYYWQSVKIPIWEINYGKGKTRLFNDSTFFNKEFPTHADAHNFILDKVFEAGFDYAFNSNVDDISERIRVEAQLEACKKGYDIISCNHSIIDKENWIKVPDIQFSEKSVGIEFSKRPPHNIISHPGVVYSKNFWTKCPKLDASKIPTDDLTLWLWGYANGYKFHIVPMTLLYYRIHPDSVAAPRQKLLR